MKYNYNWADVQGVILTLTTSFEETEVKDGETQADRMLRSSYVLNPRDNYILRDTMSNCFADLFHEAPRHIQYPLWELASTMYAKEWEEVNSFPLPSYLWFCGHPLG